MGLSALLGLRPADRRIAWLGFASLFAAITAHSTLETARDTLFLTELAPTRLPWAYLAMAAITFAVAAGSRRFDRGRDRQRVLVGTLGAASVGTAVLAWLVLNASPVVLGALYVWTGLVATLVTIAFWLRLDEQVDVARAKRIYGFVAAGGLAGAVTGALVAELALRFVPPTGLPPLAAGLYGLAAVVSAAGWAATPPAPAVDETPPARGVLGGLLREPYTRRIVALACLAPVVTIGVDFVFKSVVTRHVPTADLGPFFARYNAAIHAAALAFQVLVAPRALAWLGVTRSLVVLPLLLSGGALAVAAGATLLAAMGLRGVDATMRHSLHRAATEILYLPIESGRRGTLKAFADSVGQRGGQAIASLALLGAVQLGATASQVALGVAALAATWAAGYAGLHRHYVARFRARLRELSPESETAVPELDLSSLETLISTLSSPNDVEVLAALDVLEAYDRTRLVPPLILYHPSREVVLRALRLFEDVQRDDLDAIRRRLLEHDDEEVRAAAVRALAVRGCPPTVLWTVVSEDRSPTVRTTALVAWLGRQSAVDEAEAARRVREILATWDPASRLVLARAVGDFRPSVGTPLALQLVRGGPGAVRRAVAASLAERADPAHLEVAIALLAYRESRPFARDTLVAIGEPALARLAALLRDGSTASEVRLHVPRSISRFPGTRPAEILAEALGATEERRVRYKILRGLGRLRGGDPDLPIDSTRVLDAARHSFDRAVQALETRVAYDVHRALQGDAPGDDLLRPLLAETEDRAIEEVFRALQILTPAEEFRSMYTGLRDRDGDSAANSRELLGHVVADPGLRAGLLAMTDHADDDRERLRLVRQAWTVDGAILPAESLDAPPAPGTPAAAALATVVDDALARLLTDDDPVVAEIAAFALGASPAAAEAQA